MLSVKNIKAQYKIDLEVVDSIIDNGNGTAKDVKKRMEIVNKLQAHFDYGPTPFWFFHYWFEMDGFCKIVEDTWRESLCEGSNAMRRMMAQYKIDLEVVDSIIDNGNGTAKDVKKRMEIVNKLQGIDKLNSLEVAQKAKVKWAVEGDENSSFFSWHVKQKMQSSEYSGC
nr:hypothetical protein [Tanacetum cinerariifolium]